MRKNLSEKEFNTWKEGWMREKGCPFFACSKAMFRQECGNGDICGCLYNYNMYKVKKWTKECEIKLTRDESKKLPTLICPSCTGSMTLKVNDETGKVIGKSWCKLMNDFFEREGYEVDRHLEKYIFSLGVFMIPIIGEDAYLRSLENPDEFNLDNLQ